MPNMTEERAALVSKLLLKCADALTTARLGFDDGRILINDVASGLDAVGEALSRLQILAKGEESVTFAPMNNLEGAETLTMDQMLEEIISQVTLL